MLVQVEGRGAAATMNVLWSSKLLVWNPALGAAAWDVRKLAATGGGDKADATVTVFKTNLGNAVAAANEEVKKLDDLLSRLPYVGFLKVGDAWKAADSCVWTWLLSAFGWFATAFMASLGAPLWFDLLGKLTSRRITGPKPDTAAAVTP
jgi:hypothetical protein